MMELEWLARALYLLIGLVAGMVIGLAVGINVSSGINISSNDEIDMEDEGPDEWAVGRKPIQEDE
jgi:hypothetical protein